MPEFSNVFILGKLNHVPAALWRIFFYIELQVRYNMQYASQMIERNKEPMEARQVLQHKYNRRVDKMSAGLV